MAGSDPQGEAAAAVQATRGARRADGPRAALRAKLAPPPLPSPLYAEGRGAAWLDRVLDHRVCLIRAPAGYGKTTLAAQLHDEAERRGYAAGWVAFAPEDNEASARSYLVEAVRGAVEVSTPEDGGSSAGLTARLLSRAIQAFAKPFLLVLEDVDVLTDPQLTACLNALIESAPGNLTLVLTARARPVLKLSPAELAGTLLDITTETLALDEHDAGRLLIDAGAPLSRAQAEAINAVLVGWPAGLRAVGRELKRIGRPRDGAEAERRCIAWLDRYFASNLDGLQAADLDRLAPLAVAPRIDRDLGLTLSGEPGAEALVDRLDARGLFVDDLSCAAGWRRLHPALRACLLARLSLDQRRQAHLRAARWSIDNGRPAEAVDHALDAGDADLAARVAADLAAAMIDRSEVDDLLRWLDRLPEPSIAASPTLVRTRAWAWLLAGRADAERRIAEAIETAAVDPAEDEALNILHLGFVRDRLAEAMDQAEDWLARNQAPGALGLAERMLRALMARCAARRGHFQLVQDVARPLVLHARRDGPDLAAALATTARAAACRAQGQVAEERRLLRAGLDELADQPLAAAVVASSLAQALYENDELAEAAALAASAMPALEHSCFQAAHGRALMVAIRTAAAQGRRDEAAALAERAELIGFERDLASLKALSVVERARLGLHPSVDPESVVSRAEEAAAIEDPLSPAARAFALLSEARAYEAIMLGDRPRLTAVAAGLLQLAANADDMELRARATLFNILPQLSGRCDQMVDIETVRFLNYAASVGFSRTLVDLLDVTGVRAVQNFSSEAYEAGSFLRLLKLADPARRDSRLEAHAVTAPGEGFSFLTEREIEILGALSAGDSNKEIARALSLTPETVKWHLKNVLRKLRATSREQAVQNASTLGLKLRAAR